MEQYHRKELQQKNFFQKIFGINRRSNAYVEINNLLADKPVMEIKKEEIQDILERYNIHKAEPEYVQKLVRPLFAQILLDGIIDESEKEQLRHFANLLDIPEKDLRSILGELGRAFYHDSYHTAISDGIITDEERRELDLLANSLRLPQDEVQEIEDVIRKAFLENKLESYLKDEMFSPEEESELKQFSEDLKVELTFSDPTVKKLEQYRRFWELRFGNLPQLLSPYSKEGEKCHARVKALWYNWETVKEHYNYGGPDARFRLARGFFWSAGSVGVPRSKEEVLDLKDQGELLITNQRLHFVGSSHSYSINLKEVLNFEIFSNGLQIQINSGNHPFFEVSEDDMYELPLILERLLAEWKE